MYQNNKTIFPLSCQQLLSMVSDIPDDGGQNTTAF
jgi:hypothetical protein